MKYELMFKFLDGSLCTWHEGKATEYAVPKPGQKWGPWNYHPEPGEPDGQPCGPGGFHAMLRLSAVYAPPNWWIWGCNIKGELGRDSEKARGTAMRLRRIPHNVWWRALRLGWGRRANLTGANLTGANLTWAIVSDEQLGLAIGAKR